MIDEQECFMVDLRWGSEAQVVGFAWWSNVGWRNVSPQYLLRVYVSFLIRCQWDPGLRGGRGVLHIWGWWMCGILDGWACVTSLSCEGPQYITYPCAGNDVLTEIYKTFGSHLQRNTGDTTLHLTSWPLMKLQPIDSSCSEFTCGSPQVELMAVMWPVLHID